jgi:drug/metabolite transporter (DMT)-like permease
MKWYNYLACFFAGFFLANVIPHYVHGISGDSFPSPFANPPGKGPSSPMVNTLWALFNLVIGYLLYRGSKITRDKKLAIFIFFLGIAVCSIMLSMAFVDKIK